MSHYHQVRQGECLSRIARRYGFPNWRLIYDHPSNAEFKKKRPNPDLIFPGDRLFIPDPEPKQVDVATGTRAVITVRRLTRRLKVRLLDVSKEPIKDTPCVLHVGEEKRELTTSGSGEIDEEIPANLDSALLVLEGACYTFKLGHLNPIQETGEDLTGVQGRLRNLGYEPGPVNGQMSEMTRDAIRAFQADYGMTVDGECTPELEDRLQAIYGC